MWLCVYVECNVLLFGVVMLVFDVLGFRWCGFVLMDEVDCFVIVYVDM